jgi:hypothetical protein
VVDNNASHITQLGVIEELLPRRIRSYCMAGRFKQSEEHVPHVAVIINNADSA